MQKEESTGSIIHRSTFSSYTNLDEKRKLSKLRKSRKPSDPNIIERNNMAIGFTLS
jgi:hypothetical protein